MISKEEVEHIAKLSRLELTEKEVEKMQKDLSSILDYFDLLKKAPKLEGGVDPRIIGKEDLRKDEVTRSDLADEIIGQFPDKKDDYIKVKTIL